MPDFVGYCTVDLADEFLELTFPMTVLYPTHTPGKVENVGPYPLDVARDAPLKADQFPLVIVSHGSGGSPFVYRTLAHFLARHGFVVGLPEHTGNNRHDNTWEGTIRNLEARPRHLRTAVDFFFTDPRFAGAVAPAAVALIGHSMGGYSALALAGGRPTSFPTEAADRQPHPISVVPDSRVKALVLLAPATGWFREEGALQAVKAPVLLLTGEHDVHTPSFHAQILLNGLPNRGNITHRLVKNAGHYSFLSPFPETVTNPAFPPSQDPPGFNRRQFHAELNAEILAFLMKAAQRESHRGAK